MADIEFDAGDAKAMARTARAAAETLRGQSGSRSSAAESALADFAGSYADRFQDAVVIESEDRSKLVGVLTDLATAVDAAVAAAERERERIREHAAWTARESERRTAAVQSGVGVLADAVVDTWDAVIDREPSNEPGTRPVVDAEFRARERARYAGGGSGGKSSADPAALRGFVSTTSGLDIAAHTEAVSVRSAWNTFTSSCGWVDFDRKSVAQGFERYVDENGEDRSWMTKTAGAFEDAGGGSLSDVLLDIATMGQRAPAVQSLFASGLTPAEVAAKWAELGLTKADRTALEGLPTSVLAQLGNLEGVPYWARSTANTVVLNQRMGDIELELDRLEASLPFSRDASNAVLARMAVLEKDLKSLRNVNAALAKPKDAEGARSLISLTDDHPPLASVSIGDLDTADDVTWAVPGMDTTTADMSSWTRAAQNIYDEQGRSGNPPDRAVLAWIGYEAPDATTVLGMGKAEAGAPRLAASINGLGAVRAGRMPETNVVAHSYGTTVSAQALSTTDAHVDRFVALGSAGLPNAVDSAGKVHAEHVYVGQARNVLPDEAGQGDHLAALGRTAPGHHVDPSREAFGATVFGTDSNPADAADRKPVLNHDPLTGDRSGYLDADTESVYNVGRVTTGHEDDATAYHPKPPTKRDQDLIDGKPWWMAGR